MNATTTSQNTNDDGDEGHEELFYIQGFRNIYGDEGCDVE